MWGWGTLRVCPFLWQQSVACAIWLMALSYSVPSVPPVILLCLMRHSWFPSAKQHVLIHVVYVFIFAFQGHCILLGRIHRYLLLLGWLEKLPIKTKTSKVSTLVLFLFSEKRLSNFSHLIVLTELNTNGTLLRQILAILKSFYYRRMLNFIKYFSMFGEMTMVLSC